MEDLKLPEKPSGSRGGAGSQDLASFHTPCSFSQILQGGLPGTRAGTTRRELFHSHHLHWKQEVGTSLIDRLWPMGDLRIWTLQGIWLNEEQAEAAERPGLLPCLENQRPAEIRDVESLRISLLVGERGMELRGRAPSKYLSHLGLSSLPCWCLSLPLSENISSLYPYSCLPRGPALTLPPSNLSQTTSVSPRVHFQPSRILDRVSLGTQHRCIAAAVISGHQGMEVEGRESGGSDYSYKVFMSLISGSDPNARHCCVILSYQAAPEKHYLDDHGKAVQAHGYTRDQDSQ